MPQRKLRGKAAKAAYFVPTGNGNYTYIGPQYSLSLDAGITAKKAGARRIIISICIVALSVVCGLLPVPGMSNTFYVIIPYALTMIFGVVLLWKSSRITYWGSDSLREYVYNTTVTQLPVYATLCAVFACVSVAGEGLCLILEKANRNVLFAVIFILSHIVIFALSILLRRLEKPLEWVKSNE